MDTILKFIIGINTNLWVIINIISFAITIGGLIKLKESKKKHTKILFNIFMPLISIVIFIISIIANIFVEVPNVIGLNAENAKQTILENGLLFEFGNESNNTNKIGKQIPESGTYLRMNETITLYFEIIETIDSNTQNNVSQKTETVPLEKFPFRIEYNIIYPEAKEIKIPTPEEPGTYSAVVPLDLRAEEYQSEKVPTNTDIHGFVVNNLYYCSDDDSVTDVSKYNYYDFADYWFYLHTIDISFMDFDDTTLNFNDARIVLQEKETQKRIILHDNYLDGQFIQFKCSTGQYIIEVQKGNIAYIKNLNINKNERTFLALSSDDYYYLSPNQNDSYIALENNDTESKNTSEKNTPKIEEIPESVLETKYDDDVQLLIDEGKYMDAINLYASKTLEPTPENWCNVGDIYNYYLDDYAQAIFCYDACLGNDPTFDRAYDGLRHALELYSYLDDSVQKNN